jgi:hypothetical protein
MNYNETLKVVKSQNPTKSHKECAKLASNIYGEYKKGLQPTGKKAPGKVVSGSISVDDLKMVEDMIRKQGVNKNSINQLCHEVMPAGEMKIHGKEGVNSLVTFEDSLGNRIPIEGYFKIWI